jgi:DNA-binding NtrC family response regulator
MRWGKEPLAAPTDLSALQSALAAARDGCPQSVDVVADGAAAWQRAVHDMAREARNAGFVPVSAEVLGGIIEHGRGRWPTWLRHRSLVVITSDGQLSAQGTRALVRLGVRDVRPHVVVRGATSELSRPSRLVRPSWTLHETSRGRPARDRLPGPDDLAEQAWGLSQTAGPSDEATSRARWALMLAPSAEADIVARLALAWALLEQGRDLEARAAVSGVGAMGQDVSEGVRSRLHAVQERLRAAAAPQRHPSHLADDFLSVLEVCQEEGELRALERVLLLLRARVAASDMAFLVREDGQLRIVCQAGTVPPALPAVERVLDSALALVPEEGAPAPEGAWPVRYGAATIGVLWSRWPPQLPVLASEAHALLTLSATATAPTLLCAIERQRPAAVGVETPELVGDSHLMQELRASVLRAARSPFPVLIEGESGSGKELVARAIHRASARRDRAWRTLNCAALADELAEAELFGHARGAFTGAVADRAGLFEEANGGTLFLDEVSELSSRVQAKLLRVLQEHEVRRLGEGHVRRVDTRIVAATNRPLAREVDEGRFRRDLRYRLDVIRLAVPPLRERCEDIPALVRHVWSSLSERTGCRAVLSPATRTALCQYDWPGNVRELQNVLAAMMVSSPTRGVVGVRQLPSQIVRLASLCDGTSLARARREFEIRYVRAALARVNGRQALAARDLGVSRQGLSKLMARLGLQEDNRRAG